VPPKHTSEISLFKAAVGESKSLKVRLLFCCVACVSRIVCLALACEVTCEGVGAKAAVVEQYLYHGEIWVNPARKLPIRDNICISCTFDHAMRGQFNLTISSQSGRRSTTVEVRFQGQA
jgi:hypothetical protein